MVRPQPIRRLRGRREPPSRSPAQDHRAISVPLAPVNNRQPRTLAGTRMPSSVLLTAVTGQIPKLTVRLSFASGGPRAQGWTGKCKSGHCQCLAEVGFILSPSARTGPADLAPRAKSARPSPLSHPRDGLDLDQRSSRRSSCAAGMWEWVEVGYRVLDQEMVEQVVGFQRWMDQAAEFCQGDRRPRAERGGSGFVPQVQRRRPTAQDWPADWRPGAC
jgi:hypothetical protein